MIVHKRFVFLGLNCLGEVHLSDQMHFDRTMVNEPDQELLKVTIRDQISCIQSDFLPLERFMETHPRELALCAIVAPTRFRKSVWEYKDGKRWCSIQSWIDKQEPRASCLLIGCSNDESVTPTSSKSALIFSEHGYFEPPNLIDGVVSTSARFSISLPGLPSGMTLDDLEPGYLKTLHTH